MTMRKSLISALAGAAGLIAASFGAQADEAAKPAVWDKVTPTLVAAALESYGLDIEQRRHSNGNPLIVVQAGELVHDQGMAVLFYNCDDQDRCDTASYYTFFQTSQPIEEEVYHMWNDIFRIRTWTKAFRDNDGDTAMVLNLSAVGGVQAEALEFQTGIFITEINAFRDALEKVRDGSKTTAQLREPQTWTDVFGSTFTAMGMVGEGSVKLDEPGAPKQLLIEQGMERY